MRVPRVTPAQEEPQGYLPPLGRDAGVDPQMELAGYAEPGEPLVVVEAPADGTEVEAVLGAEPTPAEVRAWAAENDIDVSPHGKVPNHVVEAYEAAHQGDDADG